MIAAMVMIMGYSVIAVPTGIVSAELIANERKAVNATTHVCRHCSREGHTKDAIYCKYCGEELG
jgi:voltage-gated potassium channel